MGSLITSPFPQTAKARRTSSTPYSTRAPFPIAPAPARDYPTRNSFDLGYTLPESYHTQVRAHDSWREVSRRTPATTSDGDIPSNELSWRGRASDGHIPTLEMETMDWNAFATHPEQSVPGPFPTTPRGHYPYGDYAMGREYRSLSSSEPTFPYKGDEWESLGPQPIPVLRTYSDGVPLSSPLLQNDRHLRFSFPSFPLSPSSGPPDGSREMFRGRSPNSQPEEVFSPIEDTLENTKDDDSHAQGPFPLVERVPWSSDLAGRSYPSDASHHWNPHYPSQP